MNYLKYVSIPPEDKWLLLGLLNNMTKSCALLVVLLLSE